MLRHFSTLQLINSQTIFQKKKQALKNKLQFTLGFYFEFDVALAKACIGPKSMFYSNEIEHYIFIEWSQLGSPTFSFIVGLFFHSLFVLVNGHVNLKKIWKIANKCAFQCYISFKFYSVNSQRSSMCLTFFFKLRTIEWNKCATFNWDQMWIIWF